MTSPASLPAAAATTATSSRPRKPPTAPSGPACSASARSAATARTCSATSTARSTTPRPTTPARRCRAWAGPARSPSSRSRTSRRCCSTRSRRSTSNALQRREFLRLLALAAAAGGTLRPGLSEAQAAAELYDVPPFGNVSLLHVTDVHAQLLPVHFREPSVNLGDGAPPHLVGNSFLMHFRLPEGSRE